MKVLRTLLNIPFGVLLAWVRVDESFEAGGGDYVALIS